MAKKQNPTKKQRLDNQDQATQETSVASEEIKAAQEEESPAPTQGTAKTTTSGKAAQTSSFSAPTARDQIARAEQWIEQGHHQQARHLLLQVVEQGAPLEEREQAVALLQTIELDTRALLVGAVAMLTLVLIPTVGLVNALWALPLLFPILLPLTPGIAGMISFWLIPFLLPLSVTWHVKFFVPVAGLLLTLVLLFTQRSQNSSANSPG